MGRRGVQPTFPNCHGSSFLDEGGAQRCLFLGSKTTEQIGANLKFGENGYTFELIPTAADGLTFKDERIEYEGDYPRTLGVDRSIGSGQLESKLTEQIDQGTRNRPISEWIYSSISNWQVYHFHDTGDTAGMKRPSSLQDCDYLRGDASNLAALPPGKTWADYELALPPVKPIRLKFGIAMGSPTMRAYLERVQRGEADRRKIAIVATAHYLVRVMWSMMKHGTLWQESVDASTPSDLTNKGTVGMPSLSLGRRSPTRFARTG